MRYISSFLTNAPEVNKTHTRFVDYPKDCFKDPDFQRKEMSLGGIFTFHKLPSKAKVSLCIKLNWLAWHRATGMYRDLRTCLLSFFRCRKICVPSKDLAVIHPHQCFLHYRSMDCTSPLFIIGPSFESGISRIIVSWTRFATSNKINPEITSYSIYYESSWKLTKTLTNQKLMEGWDEKFACVLEVFKRLLTSQPKF